MIKKSDFVWHIGFQGNTAVVNRRKKVTIRSLDPEVLLEASHLRAAFCSALWESEIEEKSGSMDTFLEAFKRVTGTVPTIDELKRMMGVYQIPQENLYIQRV